MELLGGFDSLPCLNADIGRYLTLNIMKKLFSRIAKNEELMTSIYINCGMFLCYVVAFLGAMALMYFFNYHMTHGYPLN